MKVRKHYVYGVAAGLLFAGLTSVSRGQELGPADRQLARDVLQQLVTTDTTHSTGSTGKAAEAMRTRLLAAGFPASDVEVIGPRPERANLVIHYRAAPGSAAKPLLFICHLDVVEAKRSDWTMDPFQLTEKDGFLYGRGTQDVKDGDAALVTSLILLKRSGFVPKRDLIVALTADEEGGGDNGVDWLLQHRPDLARVDAVINPDAGGIELKDGKPVEMNFEAAEKLYADFQVVATSAGGHSSLPRPDNPIYEVGDALGRLEKQPFPVELNEVTRSYLTEEAKRATGERKDLLQKVLAQPMDQAAAEQLAADPQMNATLRTTCVATTISGGHAPNALPGSAEANVNCRILPGHAPEEVRARLISVFADAKLKVNYVDDAGKIFPTAPTKGAMTPPPMRQDVLTALQQATRDEFGPVPILAIMETGASDSIYTLAAGIPSYGITGMGIDEGDVRAHGRDERIRAEAFYKGVAFEWKLMRILGSEQ